jgi:integrase
MAVKLIRGKNRLKPYTARYTVEGRQQETSFRTLQEFRDFKVKVQHDQAAGTFIDPKLGSETFGDAARRMIAGKRAQGTRKTYTAALKHLDAFASRKLRDVANDRDGVKAATANHPQGKRMLAVIRETCQEAVNAGRLSGHRLAGLKCNTPRGRRDLVPATAEQIASLADAMGHDGLAVRIMRSTGARVSEVLALRRSDFIRSVDGGTVVHISRQVQNGEIVPLKHRSDFDGRLVPVPASLATIVAKRPDGRLFSVGYQGFLKRFRRAAREVGLPADFTPHQARHHFASTLLRDGVAITDVASWMGDEVRTVAQTYAHLMPGQADRARELLERDYTVAS